MTLLFNREDKDTVCVLEHHFCNLGCKMCHLTNSSVKRCRGIINGDDFTSCLIDKQEVKRVIIKK